MGRTDRRTDGHSTVTKTHAPHYADSAGTDDVVSKHECETFSNGTLEILSVIFDTTSSQWESEWTKLIVTGNDGRGPILYIVIISVAEWLACWTQKGAEGLGSSRSRDAIG